MNEDRIQMAQVLEGAHRLPTLQNIVKLVNPRATSILDVGCGTGVVMQLLEQEIPDAFITGIDRSYYLLQVIKRKESASKINLIQDEAPFFPFLDSSFDLVIAVQSLHEIYSFMGTHALEVTIANISSLLKENGSLIVLDHENPGYDLIQIRIPSNLFQILETFKVNFKPREIVINRIGRNEFEMSLRDFYDFITKIWALGTPLEKEEMNETHTSFTREDFVELVESFDLNVDYLSGATPIETHLVRYGIEVLNRTKLPGRHFILRAKKT